MSGTIHCFFELVILFVREERLEKGVAATDTNDRWGGKKEKKNTGENLKQSWQNSMTPALILHVCIYIKNKK